MKKIITLFLIGMTLTGCSILRPHKPDVDQGNLITETEMARIHPGMTESEVKNIMGNPVMTNIFSDNRIDYLYTFQPGYGERTEKGLTLQFQNGRLRNITRI